MTRNDDWPSISSRSASSSSCSATSALRGSDLVLATHSDHRGVKAVVCLPTYNERENLERMVAALEDKGVSVLVIDDNSPDGTGRLADELAARNGQVHVLHRQRKEGLGPAYLAGFRRVLEDPQTELVLEMDADFSHDPADVPRLIETARDADLVLGSRYVEGGSVGSW